jgi:hypothetical protein
MTRILSTIALIGLVSAGPAFAESSNGAQVFERDAIAIQAGDTSAAMATQMTRTAQLATGFDRADRSATSAR